MSVIKKYYKAMEGNRALKLGLVLLAVIIEEENPFRRMICNLVTSMGGDTEGKKNMIRQNPEFDRPARVCEVFDNLYGNTFNWMTFVGLLPHMIREERKKHSRLPEAVEAAYEAGRKELDDMDAYLREHVDYEVIPIKKLISIQLECAFTALEHLEEKKPAD